MKIPAVWLALAFAAGVLVANRWPHRIAVWALLALAAIIVGAIFASRRQLAVGGIAVSFVWFAVGGAATTVEHATVPANHVTRVIGAAHLDLSEPLRWRGRLREDPLNLPWGRRYEIDLEQVEVSGTEVPLSGGLRLNLYGGENAPSLRNAPQNLRAGDRVEALVKARPPRNFQDPGAFDLRAYLARQKTDLTGSLRGGELLQLIDRPRPSLSQRLARIRGDLLTRLDHLFPEQPENAAVLRAMLLGDRSFVDSQTVTEFQKTAAYHVLVVAGLHVGALIAFLFWICRRLRVPIAITSLVTLASLAGYVSIVEDRPPILRATLMAGFYLCARPLFRRVDLLNVVALAGLAILIWKPSSLFDSSFQLSFLAASVIAGVAVPWIERSSAPYRDGLRHLGDVTRDNAHPPKVAQFRIEARAMGKWVAERVPSWLARRANWLVIAPIRIGLRLWEIVLLSVAIQWGMAALMAQNFHRISLSGPLSNIPAVILTGLIVPLGFVVLALTFLWSRLAMMLANVLGFFTTALISIVGWFGHLPRLSYRIPGPPAWLLVAFLLAIAFVAAAARAPLARRFGRIARPQMPAPVAVTERACAVALAVLTILVATHPFAPNVQRGRLEATVLDVGQGDAIFAAFPNGRTMLVDGGGLSGSEWVGGYRSGTDVGEEVVSPYLWSRGMKRIDMVALTHADHDHIDGLYAVLDNFRVGELWIARDDNRPAFQRLLAEARDRGIRVVHVYQGIEVDEHGARAEVLWPPSSGAGAKSNDNSIVLRLSDGQVHFLLAGDIEKEAESELVAEQAPLSADLVKVPHHGSKTSSTDAFLGAVRPHVAAISVGEGNPFGHPAASVLERYESRGIRVMRTDRDGALTFLTDGQRLEVEDYQNR